MYLGCDEPALRRYALVAPRMPVITGDIVYRRSEAANATALPRGKLKIPFFFNAYTYIEEGLRHGGLMAALAPRMTFVTGV